MNLRPVFRTGLLAIAALCLPFVLPDASAHAQFNGPSLAASNSINRPVTLTTDPAILYPANRELRLAPGDQIAVHIYGATDYSPSVRISIDGSIHLPLIGTLQIKGMTLPEAERLIEKKLMEGGMYRNPQVSLQLTDSPNQVATVTGELHAVVPINGQRRLQDVLAVAGGLTPLSSHTITIDRLGVDQPIVIDLGTDPMKSEESNIPVFAGDTIIIARTGVVYMLGAFKNVGAIPLPPASPLTLMQAATVAGGPGFEGKMNQLRLIRTEGTNRTVVSVDMKRVLNGKDPDPVLQSDDIVLLPSNMIKSAIKSGGLSTLVGFASILAVATR
ncbi:MAG TPA: polysaccharide biosynthesis/export family protein [Edaphobacter sp.]|jgi:polysaccharide export outer membrane protein|nr:polysaccharide biosynthesis/export family protein [Edaphobacter sp.]